MYIPETASYHQLLEVLEDRLWDEDASEDFGYLVELVNDLYLRSIEAKVATLNGCISPGPAYQAPGF